MSATAVPCWSVSTEGTPASVQFWFLTTVSAGSSAALDLRRRVGEAVVDEATVTPAPSVLAPCQSWAPEA